MNWRKYILLALDIAVLVYLILAVTLMNNPDESKKRCREVTISIADENTNGFLDVNEIKAMLVKQQIYPLNQRMDHIAPRHIEEMLMSSPFINTAECYKSKDSLVNIIVTQRLPVIRIKADDGKDFYLDDKGGIVPHASYNSDLIIATGKFSKAFAMQSLAILAQTLTADEFWNAQIEQINVLEDGGIELIPRVGEHIVYIGMLPKSDNKEELQQLIDEYVKLRLQRLAKFYRYGLSKTGWDKYGYINVEFENQVICTKEKKHLDDEQQPEEEEATKKEIESGLVEVVGTNPAPATTH